MTASGDKVTVKLKAPNVPFASTVSQVPIVPEHLWASVTKPGHLRQRQAGRHRSLHA